MKKFWFATCVSIIFILLIGNFTLREMHIKSMNALIIEAQKGMADLGITMESRKRDYSGIFFWDIKGILSDSELYTTISDCILYFKVPIITITSEVKTNNTVVSNVVLPSIVNGILDMNPSIANEYKMAKQYKLILSTKNEINVEAVIDGVRSANNKEIRTNIPMLMLEFAEQDEVKFSKVFDISELIVNANMKGAQEMHIISDANDLNIYIGIETLRQYLTKSISVEDASKNIVLNLDLTRINTVLPNKSLQRTYKGYFNTLTRAFDVKISGDNVNTRAKTGEKKDMSDLDFSIREFDIFMEYCTGIVISMKRKAKPDYNIEKVREASQLFKDAVLQNSQPAENNIINFKIKDTENMTFFNNKPIDKVFEKFIEKAQNID